MRKIEVSWELFHHNTRLMTQWAREQKFVRIIAITRGGLVPAGIMAADLDIRFVDTLGLSLYSKDNLRTKLVHEKLVLAPPPPGPTLVIDDIADTGETMRFVQNLLPRAMVAAVYAKPQAKPLLDRFSVPIDQDVWIVFPWETENDRHA